MAVKLAVCVCLLPSPTGPTEARPTQPQLTRVAPGAHAAACLPVAVAPQLTAGRAVNAALSHAAACTSHWAAQGDNRPAPNAGEAGIIPQPRKRTRHCCPGQEKQESLKLQQKEEWLRSRWTRALQGSNAARLCLWTVTGFRSGGPVAA